MLRRRTPADPRAVPKRYFTPGPTFATTYRQMDRRTFLGLGAAVGSAGLAGCTLGSARRSAIEEGPAVTLEPVVSGLYFPVGMEFLPGGDMWIAERFGQIRRATDQGLAETPLLDLSDRMAEIEGERGLIGFAVHPEFDGETNRRFYVRYSAPLPDTADEGLSHLAVLAEFRATPDLTGTVEGSERRLLEIPEPGVNHNAGAVEFGPDGYLYTALGDGQRTNFDGEGWSWWYDKGQQSQLLEENLLGGILRIDVEPGEDRPYSIPPDNPLVGESGRDEYYAWGLRNPYRMSFDGDRLFVAQVGEDTREAVFLTEAGTNHGWPVREGSSCSSSTSLGYALDQNPLNALNPKTWQSLTNRISPVDVCPQPEGVRGPFAEPIIEYTREGSQSVTGGYVYRGDAIPELRGRYVFGDYVAPAPIFAAREPDGGSRPWPLSELLVADTESGRVEDNVLAFARDPDGEVYVLTTAFQPGEGLVRRLAPAE